MGMTTELTTPYSDRFAAYVEERSGVDPAWLLDLRQTAITAFRERGFPRRKEERWRFLPLGELGRSVFEPALPNLEVEVALPDPLAQDGPRLVFVDGIFHPELSTPLSEEAVRVVSLSEALTQQPALLEPYLGQDAVRFQENPFTALNTAFFTDGALIYLPRGTVLDAPVEIVHVTSERAAGTVAFPRNLVIAEQETQAVLVETYVNHQNDPAWMAPVNEITLGESAQLEHIKIQRHGAAAIHTSTGHVRHHGAHSVYRNQAVLFGGDLTRNDLTAILDASDVNSTINGTYLCTGDARIDNHTRIEHLQPDTESHELFKGILSGKARGVFNGRIYVAQIAQRTDAYQSNPNLLLSNDAVANSNPELEIYADDVKCSHGATYGHLEDEMLLYMRTRGIPADDAEALLIYAFAADIVERISHEGLRLRLEAELFDQINALRQDRA